MLGDAVEITDGYRLWWSYVPHFIGTPGYVYAYAYGQLLALSVYRRYLEEGEDFVPRYVELLSAGGSRSPEELAAIAGLDLEDPSFWAQGLELVRDQLDAGRGRGRRGPRGRLTLSRRAAVEEVAHRREVGRRSPRRRPCGRCARRRRALRRAGRRPSPRRRPPGRCGRGARRARAPGA